MVPNVTGTLNTTGAIGAAQRSSTSGGTGALSHKEIASGFYGGAGGVQNYTTGISFDASRVSSVYTSNTGIVVPAALFIPGWIIKY